MQVSGVVDSVYQMGSDGQHRTRVLAEAEEAATDKAVAAGADRGSCQVCMRQHLR